MSDIDLPPVPAIRGALVEWGSPLSLPGRSSRESAGDTLAEVARFLLDLADEGGELWLFDEAPPSAQPCCCDFCGDWHAAPGGSRVRVWPKAGRDDQSEKGEGE